MTKDYEAYQKGENIFQMPQDLDVQINVKEVINGE